MSLAHKTMSHAWSALLKAALALSLALFPTQAYADASAHPESEPFAPTYPVRDDYLTQNMDADLVPAPEADPFASGLFAFMGEGASALSDSGHTLYVKNTLYDARAAGESRTLEDIYARNDWMNIIAGQYGSSADLLDPGPESAYLVAPACPALQSGASTPTDHVFAEMTNDGTLVEGCTFDESTGIAYLPKSLFAEDGHDIPFACQLQLLLPVDFSAPTSCATDVTISCGDFRVEEMPDQTIEQNPFDVTCSLPVASPETAGYLTLSDIHVRLNGSAEEMELIEGQTASWDATTGMLEIAASPQTVLQADITTDAPSLLDLLASPAHATATSSLAYVPEVAFDSLNLDTLTPGRAIGFDTYINYWWPNPAPDDLHWNACINTGPYCYSWIDDPKSLYEYIAWSDGGDWSGVSSQDVSNFIFDPASGQAARHYFNYVFEFGSFTLEDQCFHSDSWPVNTPYNTGYDTANFGLQCSHATNAVGSGVDAECAGHMVLRILDVNLDAERPYVVIGFVGPDIANQPGVGIYKFEIIPYGNIELTKSSTAPDLSTGNPNYALGGITYDVFRDEACTDLACSIVLDENGHGISPRLRKGTYYLRERARSVAGHGFALNAGVQSVGVDAGKTAQARVSDEPQSYALNLLLAKADSVTGSAQAQGDATLAGAEFEVRHYRELFGDASQARQLTPSRRWTFTTDAHGQIRLDDAHRSAGDTLYRTPAGSVCMPLGTVIVKETKAPSGYRLDNQERLIQLPAQGVAATLTYAQPLSISEEVMRGGVTIGKLDAESGLADPLGGASLDGTTFEVRNASQAAVCVDGTLRAPGEVVARITSEGGCAKTASDALPFGTYEIREVAAGSGYLASDVDERVFCIDADHRMVDLTGKDACVDQVKRGDLDLRKVLEKDQSRLALIPFVLASETTGEAHVVVTDENGIINTASAWHAHTHATNANDHVLESLPSEDALGTEQAPIASEELDPDAGVWFGLTGDGIMTEPNDELGALPCDTYSLQELRADTNEGLDLVRIEGIGVRAHGLSVPLGDIEDRLTAPPSITTQAQSAGGSKEIHPDPDARIIDRIAYENLIPGHAYAFTGCLMDAESAEKLTDEEGNPITSCVTLVCVAPTGSVEVAFSFDASAHAGKRIVCFEEVVDQDSGQIVAVHEDLDDHSQSVDVAQPRITTYATDEATDSKDIAPDATVCVTDAISYSDLEAGAGYVLTGSLMCKRTEGDEVVAEPVVDDDGNPLVCEHPFTPDATVGTTAVSFSFAREAVPPGSELVVYETLNKDGREVVVHEDPRNDAQTVRLIPPTLTTHAFDEESGLDSTKAADGMTICDEVSYAGLVPGKTYTIFGTLMRAHEDASGHITADALIDETGNKVTASLDLVPETTSGTAQVRFSVDAAKLAGERLVVYERIVDAGTLIAAHEDATAKSQTIWIEDAPATPSEEPRAKTPVALPQTGDSTPGAAAVLLLLSAGGASAFAAWRWKRERAPRDRMRESR